MAERTEIEESKETSEDHISALPDDLLLDVLSLLTADEAVQTCVLARRWRDLWMRLPSLRLLSTEHFNSFVNRLIELREPLCLVDCEIDLCHDDTDELSSETFPYPYVIQWIQYALASHARLLRVIVDEDYFDQQLRLNVPLVSQHLMTLHLNSVDLLCSMDFSSCPVLEDLKVSNCEIHAHMVSSRSLKRMCIGGCCFPTDYRTLLSTPSLNTLQLSTPNDCDGMTPLTESMPLLETAFVRLAFSSDCCSYSKNLAVGNCGDESCVGCFGYPYIFRRDLASCPVFSKLKTLVLNWWVAIIDLDALASVLQHSPILEILTLELKDNQDLVSAIGPEENYDPREQPFACTRLKVVNIECEQDNEKVRKILKFLTTCGIPAEQISVKKIFGLWLN
ncbi:hypothetical protein BRADI_4g23238v3, partial [Brachypodium distachyon]